MTESVDLLILGAGCAGLGLAARLAQATRRVLLVEPRVDYDNDRTWCFWAPPSHELSDLVIRRWNRWHISVDAQAEVHEHLSNALPYQCIPADRYYAWALGRCDANPTITIKAGVTATAVRRVGRGFRVETSAGSIDARQIVDTRPDSSSERSPPLLEQVFAGCEIQLPKDCITPSVGVMERLRVDRHGLLFDYVLPLAEDRVLVEATRFALTGLPLEVLEHDLAATLAQRGWTEALVNRRERGRLPMGLQDVHERSSGWVHAGTVGGGLRAASGYGFQRIQAWARHCSEHYARHGLVVAHPPEPRWRQWMDLTFLRALRARPELAPRMFAQIGIALSGDGFARFMSDTATVADWLRVVGALPPTALLRAAFSS